MGRAAEARQMIERLDEISNEGQYISPVLKGWIHAGLGEADDPVG
jgi:hypothetical protein